MAAVFASCSSNVRPMQLSGKAPRADYLSQLTQHRVPRCAPRPRLTYCPPKLTLRQIYRTLKMMKQVQQREAAAAAAARIQASATPTTASPGTKPEKKCVPSCLRYKRNIKRVCWPRSPGQPETIHQPPAETCLQSSSISHSVEGIIDPPMEKFSEFNSDSSLT